MVCPCKSTSAWAVVVEAPTNQPAAAIQKPRICCNQSWLVLGRAKLMTGSDVSWKYITAQIPEHHSTVRRVNHTVHTRTHTEENLQLEGSKRVTHQWGIKDHSVLGGTLGQRPDPKGETPTASPAAPQRTHSSWVLWQGSVIPWSGVSCEYCSQSSQTEAQGAQRCQIALGHRPDLYYVLVQAVGLCTATALLSITLSIFKLHFKNHYLFFPS